ncbi:CocE/NonD family hydrolase [Streptomyces scopuliridis]|uniref:CocE/NonD family hydrolase n=1 Tax=Streptomyces scopuliridis TaxID=452529 RepID=UPI0036A39A07
MRCGRQDGLDTLDWLVEQPWCGDALVLVGGSYLGAVQWAVADQRPSQVKAIVPGVSESALMLNFLQPDAFNLEAPIIWGVQVATQERRLAGVRQLLEERKVHRACRPCHWNGPMSPPSGAAQTSSRTSCATTAEGPFSTADHCRRVSGITVLAALVGGWYDVFLPGRLRDFKVLQDNGVDAPLTVGPWTHMSVDAYACITREALDFGLPYAHGRQPADRAPVRLFVTGSEQWRDFPTWPPPGYRSLRHHLQLDGAPAVAPPPASSARLPTATATTRPTPPRPSAARACGS